MKFGPVVLDLAEGALLAHSIRLETGRLRKGQRLSPEDIATLREAGRTEVTVARPETGDLEENEAAQTLARTLQDAAKGMHLSAPFTGRVNLLADVPGVVLIDADRITAANRVDPMITLATVAQHHQIHPGGMVATVKIISYAVPCVAVAQAAEAARGAIRIAAPIFETASLIVTEITRGPGLKGVDAIKNRVTGLGMVLESIHAVPHEEAALAKAIGAATGDIVLILTGSATSDAHDTMPEALRSAGGRVERFGIPVDPGNLLVLGTLGDKPVIGLPGSARSPVLHGADWVLSRVACGVPVGADEIAAMGVGGLLKEIPTRPQPRQRSG